MLKNKLNFKLINSLLIVMIIYFVYQAGGLWGLIFSKALGIIIPVIVAFALAYALYPYVQLLMKKNLPKGVALLIVLAIFFGLFTLVFVFAIPLLLEQLTNLISTLITFSKDVSMKYDLNFGPLQDILTSALNGIVADSTSGALSFIGTSVGYISTGVIIIFLGIYLLVDMDKIRKNVKEFYITKGKKRFNYVLSLDHAMKGYLDGFTKIMGITLVEYMLAFALIGHPNAVLLGFLASVGNLIPYFGGIFTHVIAMITAFVVSPALFIRALILFVVLSLFDSYVINPFIYGKTTKLPSIAIILSVFIGGSLFGIFGIVVSLPVTIILVTTFRYYREDIKDKIEELKS